MITKKEVQHVAKLARLGITEKEIGKFQNDLSSVLGYIEKLEKVDVSKTEPTTHPLVVENVKRRDEFNGSRIIKKELLEMAPELKDGYIKVKSVLK